MANYKKITDVEVMEQVGENSMALVEDNGTLKKVPCGKGFGGGNPAVIIDRNYDNDTLSCNAMSFADAVQMVRSGEILDIIIRNFWDSQYGGCSRVVWMELSSWENIEYMTMEYIIDGDHEWIYWYSNDDGIYTNAPGSPT